MANIAEENATSGNTIVNLNDPKYSDSKSPIMVSTLQSKAISPSIQSPHISTFENDEDMATAGLKVEMAAK